MNIFSSFIRTTATNPTDRLADLEQQLQAAASRLDVALDERDAASIALTSATAGFGLGEVKDAELDEVARRADLAGRKVAALESAVEALTAEVASARSDAADYASKIARQARLDRLKANRKTNLASIERASKLAAELKAIVDQLSSDTPEAAQLLKDSVTELLKSAKPVDGDGLARYAADEIDAQIAGTTLAEKRAAEARALRLEEDARHRAWLNAANAETRARREAGGPASVIYPFGEREFAELGANARR